MGGPEPALKMSRSYEFGLQVPAHGIRHAGTRWGHCPRTLLSLLLVYAMVQHHQQQYQEQEHLYLVGALPPYTTGSVCWTQWGLCLGILLSLLFGAPTKIRSSPPTTKISRTRTRTRARTKARIRGKQPAAVRPSACQGQYR